MTIPKLRSPGTAASLLLTAVGCLLLALVWEKWGSLTVDCGREMYVPAAIGKGRRLYLDLWYPYGPFAPYWNALLFRIFGTHLAVLYASGMAIVALIAILLYRLSRIFLPVTLSFAAACVFLIEGLQPGNFNYILPYSYAAAYGSLFTVAIAFTLIRNCYDPRPWRIPLASTLVALALLTKIEFGLANCFVLACALALRAFTTRSVRAFLTDLAACLPAILIAAGIYVWLVHQTSFGFMFEQNITISPNSYFVRRFGRLWVSYTGMAKPRSALPMLLSCIGYGAVLVAGLRFAATAKAFAWALSAVFAIACAALMAPALDSYFPAIKHAEFIPENVLGEQIWKLVFNPGMLWGSALLLLVTLPKWWRGRLEPSRAATLILCVASIAAGLRVSAHIIPGGYAMFYNLLPYLAWLLALYTALRILPAPRLDRALRLASAILCIGVASLAFRNYVQVQAQSYPLRTPRGDMYVEPSIGRAYATLLSRLTAATARSEPWVTMPEDVSLYFLSGTLAPSRWYVLTPGILPPGELTRDYLAELDRARVKYVVLSNRAAPEYETPIFGEDYNQQVYSWLTRNFRLVETVGPYERVPYPKQWGALLFERVTSPR